MDYNSGCVPRTRGVDARGNVRRRSKRHHAKAALPATPPGGATVAAGRRRSLRMDPRPGGRTGSLAPHAPGQRSIDKKFTWNEQRPRVPRRTLISRGFDTHPPGRDTFSRAVRAPATHGPGSRPPGVPGPLFSSPNHIVTDYGFTIRIHAFAGVWRHRVRRQ